MWSSRLFWKLFIAYGALYLLFAALFPIVFANQERNLLTEKVRMRLQSDAVYLTSLIDQLPENQPRETLQSLVTQLARKTQTRVTIVNREGIVQADSHEDPHLMGFHG